MRKPSRNDIGTSIAVPFMELGVYGYIGALIGGEVGIPEYREPRFVKFRNQNKEGAAFRFVKQQSGRNNEVLTLV
jgi:hypothetical protein